MCRPDAEEAFFSCTLENAALNLAGVISWFMGAMLGGFLNVLMNSITSGIGSFTSKSTLMIWLALCEVPSNLMRSARGPVANGGSKDCLKCLSFCSRIASVTLALSLSLFQLVTALVGGYLGF
jgi:hypothetical protein